MGGKLWKKLLWCFDIYNPKIDTSSRLVKLWNSDHAASAYVNDYVNKRSDLYWGYSDGDVLTDFAPEAIIELHGYADDAHLEVRDIITVYHVEAEDPDEDQTKRLLRISLSDFETASEKAFEEDDEEAPYLKYTAECFRRMLDEIDKIEQKNLEIGGE